MTDVSSWRFSRFTGDAGVRLGAPAINDPEVKKTLFVVSSVKKAFIAAANSSLLFGDLEKLHALFPRAQKPLGEIDGVGCVDYSGNIIDLVLSSDEESMLVATDDGKLQIVDTTSIKEKSQISVLYESDIDKYQCAISRPRVGGSWTVLTSEGKAFQLICGNQCLIALAEAKKVSSLSWHPSGLYLLAGETGSNTLSLIDFSGYSLAQIPLPDDLAEGGTPTYSTWLDKKTFIVIVRDAEDEYFFETLICDLSNTSDFWRRKDEDLCYASLSLKKSRNQTWYSEHLEKWSREPFFLMALSQSTEVGLVPVQNPDVDYEEDFHQCTIPVTVDDPEEYGPVGVGFDLTDQRGVDSDGKYDPEGAPQPVVWILDSQVKLHGYHISCSDTTNNLNVELNMRKSSVEDAKSLRLAIAGQLKCSTPESAVSLGEKSISKEIVADIPSVIESGCDSNWANKSLAKETVLDELFLALESMTGQEEKPISTATEARTADNAGEQKVETPINVTENSIDPLIVADSAQNSEDQAQVTDEVESDNQVSDSISEDPPLDITPEDEKSNLDQDEDNVSGQKSVSDASPADQVSSHSIEETGKTETNESTRLPNDEVTSKVLVPTAAGTSVESKTTNTGEGSKVVEKDSESAAEQEPVATGSLSASKFAPKQPTAQDATESNDESKKSSEIGQENLDISESKSSVKPSLSGGVASQPNTSLGSQKQSGDRASSPELSSDESKNDISGNEVTVDSEKPRDISNSLPQSEYVNADQEKKTEDSAKDSAASFTHPGSLSSSSDLPAGTSSPGKSSFLNSGTLNPGRFGQAFGGSTTSSMPFTSSVGSTGFGFGASSGTKPFSFSNSANSGTKLFEPSSSNSGGFSAFADGKITSSQQDNGTPFSSFLSPFASATASNDSSAQGQSAPSNERTRSNRGMFEGSGSSRKYTFDDLDRELTSEEESEVSDADEYDENDMEEAYSLVGVKSDKVFDQQIKALNLSETPEINDAGGFETSQLDDEQITPVEENAQLAERLEQGDGEDFVDELESDLEEPFEISEFVEFDWTSQSRPAPNAAFFGEFKNYLEDCSGIDEIILQAFEDTVTVHSNFSLLNDMISGQKVQKAPLGLSDLAKSDSWNLSDTFQISSLIEQLKARIDAIREDQGEASKKIEKITVSSGTLMLNSSLIEDLLKAISKEVSPRTLALRSMPLQAMKMKRKVDTNFSEVTEQLNKVDSELNVLRLDLARRYKLSKLTEEGVKNSITTLSEYGKKVIKRSSAVVSQYEAVMDTSTTLPDESFQDEAGLNTLREETQDRLAFLARKGRRKARANIGNALRQRSSSVILNKNLTVETSLPFVIRERTE